jgi:hypothetical protein
MFHGDFTEFAPIALKLKVRCRPTKTAGPARRATRENQHAYRALLRFLNAKLRDRPSETDELLAEIKKADGATIVHLPRAHVRSIPRYPSTAVSSGEPKLTRQQAWSQRLDALPTFGSTRWKVRS